TACARAGEVLAGATLDNGNVDSRQRQLARQHQPCRTSSGDHHRMLGHGHTPRLSLGCDAGNLGVALPRRAGSTSDQEVPMSTFAAAGSRTLGRVLPPWWLLLITGIGWTIVALIVLRFDYTSVSAVSILFGIVAISAGVLEIGVLMLAAGWWKLLHGVLVVVFIAAGIVAFIHPGDTFAALAGVFSFFLVLAGPFEIIFSFAIWHE